VVIAVLVVVAVVVVIVAGSRIAVAIAARPRRQLRLPLLWNRRLPRRLPNDSTIEERQNPDPIF
jgi:hypothetical protein